MTDIYEKKPKIRNGRAHRAAFNELLFADDTLLISKKRKAMHDLLHLIESESEYYNLRLNQSKCVVMDIKGISNIHFKNFDELKKEQNAKYLGGIINSEARRQEEINTRIKDTYAVFNKLKIFWRKVKNPIAWKIRVFNAVVTAKLEYGLETLTLLQSDLDKIDSIFYKGLRRILNVESTLRDRSKSNKFLINEAN